MKKGLLVFVILVAVAIAAVVFYLNRPKRTASGEKGIEVTAAQLVKDYQEDENKANSKYLDKTVEVTGTVTDVSKNQEGKTTVMLASEDEMTGVFCTLKEDATNLSAGATATLKGFCSGMLSDVRIREAIVVNKTGAQ